MTTKSIVLILGAGPRVGAAVAEKFLSNGFQVAIASRSGNGSKNDKGFLTLKADLSNPDSIPPVFEAVKAEFQAFPSVVVYNAAALTPPPDENSIFSVSSKAFTSDLNINTVSPYVAAQQAVAGWETLPKETKKSFIYTGNILNTTIFPVPMMLTLGVGKSGSAHWLGLADALYASKGSRFFYADERYDDGKSKGMELDGPAHGEFFAQLAAQEENIPWHATFVKGQGYKSFN